MSESSKKKKSKFHFPSGQLMLFIIIVLVAVLTYIIPAGKYEYVTDPNSDYTVVDGNSFRFIENSPVNPFQMFVAIQKGFIDGAMVVFLILFGYFWVYSITQTGAFNALIGTQMKSKAKDSKLFIPIIFIIFALAGSTYGEMDTVYGLLPIFIALSIALGYDAMVGLCMTGMAVVIGFASATTNPFTIGIAQAIGGLPIFSGLGFRWIIFFAFTSVGIFIVMRYAKKVKADPTKSTVYGLDFSMFELDLEGDIEFTPKRKLIMCGMVATIALIVTGSLQWGWYINEMSAVFIISGIITSLIDRKTPEQIVENMIKALGEMIGPMLVVGLSRAILVIMQEGMIIDSVIYGLSNMMQGLSKYGTAGMMLVAQNIVNFFIPSGSGQATAIMPIMIPLADLTGVSRQIAVLAYQFGDGFSNLLWPSGPIAILCSIAKIPLGRWYKFFIPVFAILFAMQLGFIFIAVAIGFH